MEIYRADGSVVKKDKKKEENAVDADTIIGYSSEDGKDSLESTYTEEKVTAELVYGDEIAGDKEVFSREEIIRPEPSYSTETINSLPNYNAKNVANGGIYNNGNNFREGESYFDGGLFQLIGWKILGTIVTLCTFFICFPWAVCMIYSWETKHTVINGRRLKFNGKATQLFGTWIKWLLLCLITCGIYSLWIPISLKKWQTKHTEFADEFNPNQGRPQNPQSVDNTGKWNSLDEKTSSQAEIGINESINLEDSQADKVSRKKSKKNSRKSGRKLATLLMLTVIGVFLYLIFDSANLEQQTASNLESNIYLKINQDKMTAEQIGYQLVNREKNVKKKDRVPTYPKLAIYDDINNIAELERYGHPISRDNGYYIVTSVSAKSGKKIMVGVGEPNDRMMCAEYDEMPYSGAGWLWVQDDDIETFLTDVVEPMGHVVYVPSIDE